MTSALTNQQRVLALAARRASAICPANDTSGATYLMTSHVSSALWTLRADVDLTIFFLRKSAIFHSIKLPFDVEVDEKFLNVI